jgi:hypothetical protein
VVVGAGGTVEAFPGLTSGFEGLGALVDFFKVNVADGNAFDGGECALVRGCGLIEPDPNVPELITCKW